MLNIVSTIVGTIVARRNAAFDSGKKPLVHVSVPVISVGNLSVGGSGKTPVVQMIVRLLQAQGMRPGVILRGYRRRSRGVVVVHDGNTIRCSVRDAGDEAMLHAQELNVPVVVGEYKADAAVLAAGTLPCDVLVADDAFQHRWLHRDIDVVLVDQASIDAPFLLPKGRLREPLESLRRADVILIPDAVAASAVAKYCKPSALLLEWRVQAVNTKIESLRVLALSGIANPKRFISTLKSCGAEVVDAVSFPDHHWYAKSDVERVAQRAAKQNLAVVTTQKDAVKLTHGVPIFAALGVSLHVVPIAANLVSGNDAFVALLKSRCRIAP